MMETHTHKLLPLTPKYQSVSKVRNEIFFYLTSCERSQCLCVCASIFIPAVNLDPAVSYGEFLERNLIVVRKVSS